MLEIDGIRSIYYLRTSIKSLLVMVALCNRADHYIFILFLLSSFFSSPNLSGRKLDVYHTLAHGVALVRIQNAGLKHAACGSLEM